MLCLNSGMSYVLNGSGACREQDRFLPIANINRIMKRTLPPNAKVAKEAKDVIQECVSEFISFITSEYVRVVDLLLLFFLNPVCVPFDMFC